jgi:ABC-type transporter Mla subunit MlaD
MSRPISHFKLGLLVLVCGGLGIGALIWIGVAQFFQHTKTYAAFFNVSVEGLQKGAPVNHLGLRVGRVSSIGLAPDGHLIMVLIDVRPDFKVSESMAIGLAQAGITGQRYLAIGKAPADIDKVTPSIHFSVKYPVIRTHPGEMTDIKNALETLYKKLESLDFQGLVAEWKQAAQGMNGILSDKDIQATLRNVREISADLKDLLSVLGRPGNPDEWRKGLENMAKAVAAARKASEALEASLEGIPPNTFGDLAKRMDRMVQMGESAVGSLNKQIDDSLALFQQSVFQVNQLLSELKGLVQSLREEPGRILNRPQGSEPFGR